MLTLFKSNSTKSPRVRQQSAVSRKFSNNYYDLDVAPGFQAAIFQFDQRYLLIKIKTSIYQSQFMIIKNLPKSEKFDVVIIGGGPAGITLALELAKDSKKKICLLETGELSASEDAQKFADTSASGDLPGSYFTNHSMRFLGGGTNIWGGWCGKLERRAFSQGSWPITLEELDPYYQSAAEVIGLSKDVYEQSELAIDHSENLIYKPFHIFPRKFREYYQAALESQPNISLLLGHTCLQLVSNSGAVQYALIQATFDTNAVPKKLFAERYVLACGGIANPKMLKQSKIADNSPVGNYFADHPHYYAFAKTSFRLDRLEKYAVQKPYKVRHALQLSSDYCAKHNLLSFSVDFETSTVEPTKIFGKDYDCYITASNVRTEMPLLTSNSVSLDNSRQDPLQRPLPHLDFNFTNNEQIERSWQVFAEEVLRSGLGRVDQHIEKITTTGGGHFMCSTRMGTDPSSSVVDKNCRVHTQHNLFIAGSSVFSSPGATNPTYTIVALAMRLANYLATT
jgi:choline dehydrogenase-like flavoprotein